MRTSLGLLIVGGLIVLAIACTGEDAEVRSPEQPTSDASRQPDDSGAMPTNEAGSRINAPPTHLPARLFFHNQDVTIGKIEGSLTITRAEDESDVEEYVVYYGASATSKVDDKKIVGFKIGPAEHVFTFPPETSTPVGATHLLVYSRNAIGESTDPIATLLSNAPTFVDLGASITTDASAGELVSLTPFALLDPSATKLIVLGTNEVRPGPPTGAYVCKIDGTGCAVREICNNLRYCAGSPVGMFAPSGKLLVVGRYFKESGTENTPVLYECSADAQNCTAGVNLATGTGAGPGSGELHNAFLDTTASKLLVVTSSNEDPSSQRNGHALLFRSNFDGTSSEAVVDLTAKAQTTAGGYDIRSTFDPKRRVVYIAGHAAPPATTIWLTICVADGTSCFAGPLSTSSGLIDGQPQALLIDEIDKKVLVVLNTGGETDARPALMRCDLAGSNCNDAILYLDTGQPVGTGFALSATLDPINDKLLVLAQNRQAGNKLSLFRCDRTGRGCRHIDMSAKQGDNSGMTPMALIDASGRFLLGVTQNLDKAARPSLFRWGL